MRTLLNKLFVWGLPVLALAAGGFGVAFALARPTPGETLPPAPPAASPFESRVGGIGLIEPRGRVIDVGTNEAGIVTQVAVEPGDAVAVGDTLLVIDDRVQTAQVQVAEQQVASAEALVLGRRASVAAAEADEAAAAARLADAELTRDRLGRAGASVSADELDEADLAVQVAQANAVQVAARTAQAEAELAAAEQAVAEARARLAEAQARLEQYTTRSPIDGRVLAVDVRPGEFANPNPTTPLMTLGDLSAYHVRVSVDETTATRVRPDAPAAGYLRGAPDEPYALEFVRREPLAVQKGSLTGGRTELVDTRVVEFIYRVAEPDEKLTVGSQMDVFVEAP